MLDSATAYRSSQPNVRGQYLSTIKGRVVAGTDCAFIWEEWPECHAFVGLVLPLINMDTTQSDPLRLQNVQPEQLVTKEQLKSEGWEWKDVLSPPDVILDAKSRKLEKLQIKCHSCGKEIAADDVSDGVLRCPDCDSDLFNVKTWSKSKTGRVPERATTGGNATPRIISETPRQTKPVPSPMPVRPPKPKCAPSKTKPKSAPRHVGGINVGVIVLLIIFILALVAFYIGGMHSESRADHEKKIVPAVNVRPPAKVEIKTEKIPPEPEPCPIDDNVQEVEQPVAEEAPQPVFTPHDAYLAGKRLVEEGNEVGGLEKIEDAAERNYVEAQLYLGNHYENKDIDAAVKWYRKAAENGDAYAQNKMGNFYHTGRGVKKNGSEAYYWYERGAKQGNPAAAYSVGLCYENGEGVECNFRLAKKYYQTALDGGYAGAKSKLSGLSKSAYKYGMRFINRKNKSDRANGLRHVLFAAEEGYAQAQYAVGRYYYVECQKYEDAVHWLKAAAGQDHAGAQCALGCCYINGDGVSQDISMARYWLEKAAQKGNAQAKEELSKLNPQRQNTHIEEVRRINTYAH